MSYDRELSIFALLTPTAQLSTRWSLNVQDTTIEALGCSIHSSSEQKKTLYFGLKFPLSWHSEKKNQSRGCWWHKTFSILPGRVVQFRNLYTLRVGVNWLVA